VFGPLPSSWREASIRDLADSRSHALAIGPFGSDLKTSDYCDQGVPIVFVRDIEPNCFAPKERRYVSERKAKQLKAHAVLPGDLVITKMGTPPCVAAVYPANEAPGIVTADIIKLSIDVATVERNYLSHVLNSDFARNQIAGITFGITRPKVTLRDFETIRVPLPPLPEQRRIAEVLDRAEALRAKRRAALAQLDTLTQSIFLDLFGDPGENPKAWPIHQVSDYVAEFQGGKSLEAESGENVAARNRVLKISAVTSTEFEPDENKPAPDSYEPPSDHFVRPGDLLFSRANTTELVGAVAYVERTPPNLLLPDKLWRFVWRDPAAVEPLFVRTLFHTPAVRREIARRATGTSGSMKNISQEKLFGIRTILPPLSLQSEFVRSSNAVDTSSEGRIPPGFMCRGSCDRL